jgi:predicted RNA-binding protein with PUA-like domain
VAAIRAILKTEPSEYSFDDLQRDGATIWEGISNYAALNSLKTLKVGDAVAIYHTGSQRAAIGIGIVAKAAYRPIGVPNKFLVVRLRAGRRFSAPVSLEELKAEPSFQDSPLLQNGRLSVVLLSAEQSEAMDRLSRRPAARRTG